MVEVQKVIDPYIDLGNLLLIDQEPLDAEVDEEKLAKLTRDNAQFLYNELWKLPRKVVEDATCAMLPECKYQIPREKSIPKPKPPTKWETFAKNKGIGNKNDRSRKVWDNTQQDWKPRYGYRRGNDDTNDWLIEVPDNADPYKDYFGERKNAKRERVDKNEFQRLRNVATNVRNTSSFQESGMPSNYQQDGTSGNREHGREKGNNPAAVRSISSSLGFGAMQDKSKQQLVHLAYRAKQSTASLGKFQGALKGDKIPKGLGKKRKFAPNEGGMAEERDRQLKILSNLEAKRPKLNTTKVSAVDDFMKKQSKRQNYDDDEGEKSGTDSAKKRVTFGNRNHAEGRRSKGGNARGNRRGKSQVHKQQKFRQQLKTKSKFKGPNKPKSKQKGGRKQQHQSNY